MQEVQSLTVNKSKFVDVSNSQLSDPYDYDVSHLRFSELITKTIRGEEGGLPVKINRIYIGTVYKNGKVGELLFKLKDELFSFGVSQSNNKYQTSICLFTKDNPTDNQRKFVSTINNICKKTIQYLVEIRETIGFYDLCESDLRKINPIWYTRTGGKPDMNKPVLYVKLPQDKHQKVTTMFIYNGTEVDIMELEKIYFTMKNPVLLFECISIVANKFKIKIVLTETKIKKNNGIRKRFNDSSDDEMEHVSSSKDILDDEDIRSNYSSS